MDRHEFEDTGIRAEVLHKHNATLPRVPDGKHMWVMTGMWRVDPAPDAKYNLDHESLLTLEGPGCYLCEEHWSAELAAQPCRANQGVVAPLPPPALVAPAPGCTPFPKAAGMIAERIANDLLAIENDLAVKATIIGLRDTSKATIADGLADGVVVVARGRAADRLMALIHGSSSEGPKEITVRDRP